ncbi:MAG: hypothetical protein ACREFD_10790 [Stellaceae bacterium]
MTRLTLTMATIAVAFVVAIGNGARAQALDCPPGHAPDQNNAGCSPSRSSADAGQRDGVAQVQQFPGGGATNDDGRQGLLVKMAAWRPCALLTAADVAGVLRERVKWSSAGTKSPVEDTQCSYSTTNGDEVDLMLGGGRAEFDQTVRQLQKSAQRYKSSCQSPPCLTPLTKLSGVGDAAFLNRSGSDTTQVYVIEGGTFFTITLQTEREHAPRAKHAVALAHKVADRIK